MASSMGSYLSTAKKFWDENPKKEEPKPVKKKASVSQVTEVVTEVNDKLSTVHGLYKECEESYTSKMYGKVPESASDLIGSPTSVVYSSKKLKPCSNPSCRNGLVSIGYQVSPGYGKQLSSKGYPSTMTEKQYQSLGDNVKKFYMPVSSDCPTCKGKCVC